MRPLTQLALVFVAANVGYSIAEGQAVITIMFAIATALGLAVGNLERRDDIRKAKSSVRAGEDA